MLKVCSGCSSPHYRPDSKVFPVACNGIHQNREVSSPLTQVKGAWIDGWGGALARAWVTLGQPRHSSIQITVDIYGHLVPGANRQAVNRLPTIKDAPSEEELKKASGG